MEGGINRSYYMTPTKETLEVPNAIKDTTIPKANANASAGHLRADAVSLDVPVKVHGTRVIEAVRGAVPQTEPFEETTSTMIVFPLGAVVKMETAVVGGQMVVVTNLKSGHDAICRIVKVRPYAQKHCYVEIEFTHRQPGYWGVQFSSDTAANAPAMGPSAAVGNPHAPKVAVEMKVEKGHDADVDEQVWELAGNSLPKLGGAGVASVPAVPSSSAAASVIAPAATLASPVRPSKPESVFAPIGSQEEVQAAASATNVFGVDSFTRSERAAQAGGTHGHSATAEISEPLPVATEGGHALSQPAHVAPFGRFAAATNLGNAVAENIRDTATSYLEARKHQPKVSPMLLGIAALVITVVGGALFFYLGPFTSAGSAPEATAPVSSPVAANNLATASAVAAANMTAPPAAVVPASEPVRAAERAPEKVIKAPVKESTPPAPVEEAVQPPAPVHVKPAVKVPDMFGALNAHPVSPQRGSDASAQAAPSIDATSASGPLKALPSSIAPLSPLGETSAPTQAGSLVKPPKLVSSVLPIYPQIAQQAGVEGDVVIQASIDQNGNVVATKPLAGPLMLRQAAIDAVRRWKYEPALLDGKPVPTEMTVRIRFHR